MAGSFRRKKETIGDIDILIALDDLKKVGEVMKHFVSNKRVVTIIANGETKSSVITDSGIQVDLRVVSPDSFGAALHYFTGSKEHNIQIRTIAKQKGLSSRASSALLIKQKYQKPRPYLFMRDRYIYNDLNRRNGSVIFTSAEGGEIAFEHPKIKNGFFTAAIINALSSKKTDLNRDGKISMTELENVVRYTVSLQTNRLQNPIIERDNIYQEFSFPVLK